jgi:hypothetical protein
MITVSQSYITTDGQSASLSWYQAPIWGLWPDFYYFHTITGLSIWGALSDERTGLSFTMYNVQYILLSQIWEQVPVCISPRNRVARLYPQALGAHTHTHTSHSPLLRPRSLLGLSLTQLTSYDNNFLSEFCCRYSARTNERWSCRGPRWLVSAWFNVGGSHKWFRQYTSIEVHGAMSQKNAVLTLS